MFALVPASEDPLELPPLPGVELVSQWVKLPHRQGRKVFPHHPGGWGNDPFSVAVTTGVDDGASGSSSVPE